MAEHPDTDEIGRLSISPTVVSTQTGENTVVHDMITQQLYRLNDVGTRIWELIDGGNGVDMIVRTISAEYQLPSDVSPTQLRADVMTILADLRRHGLVLASSHA